MDADSLLKDTLQKTLINAVSRIEQLKDPSDRRCLFHEYKEWLGPEINDEVWALPVEVSQGGGGTTIISAES